MKLYSTVFEEGVAEQTIEKSKFIAYVRPIETREEAEEFIGAIRKKHRDATHNVPAIVLGEKFQIQWASDDGEPQGTSGAPIVQMLVREGITNVVVVVTRYFGGIKLGTGGLVRAYTSSAKLGLEAAGICNVEEMSVLEYSFDYTYLPKIQNMASNDENIKIDDIKYTDVVTVKLLCVPEVANSVKSKVQNITGGREILKSEQIQLVKN